MKTHLILFYFWILSAPLLLHSQANIEQRMTGYRSVEVEYGPYNYGYLFDADSAEFYYSDNNTIVENPFETYLRLDVDTLSDYIEMTVQEYNRLYHSHYLFDPWPYGSYYFDKEELAFDSAQLYTYSTYDEEWEPSFAYSQDFNNERLVLESWYTYGFEETRYESIYNNNGRLIKYIHFSTWGFIYGDTASVILFNYDNGRLASKTRIYYDYYDEIAEQDTDYTYEYEYNDNDELITKTEYTSNDLRMKWNYEYENGKISKMTGYSRSNDAWHFYYSYDLVYENGKLSAVFVDNEDVTESSIKCKFTYNDAGRPDSISRYEYDHGFQELNWFETFDYDDAGRLSFYTSDDDIYHDGFDENYLDYDYNDKGQIIVITDYGFDSDWGYYANDLTFTWNEKGNMATRSSNEIYGASKYSEVFDELNDINAGTRSPDYITTFYYEPLVQDPAGSESGTVYIHAYPSPADDQIHVIIANAEDNGIITIRITDIEGQVMYESQEQSATNFIKTIDCTNFHPGIYLVYAKIGGNKSVQKIVIK